jgi:hypothetical protein
MTRGILSILIASVICITLQAQQPPLINSGGGPKSARTALMEMGIGVDSGSLKAALSNSDAHVRGLAAVALATSKDSSAAPDIESALIREKDPFSKLRMAGSLFQLSPSEGLHYMTDMCQDPQLAKTIRLNAASALMILDQEGTSASPCVPQLFELLKDDSSPLHQANALSLLNMYRSRLKPAELDDLRTQSIKYVRSRDFGLKAAAVHSLVADDSPVAKDALQRAVDDEPDPADQKFMRDVIQKSPRQQKPPTQP